MTEKRVQLSAIAVLLALFGMVTYGTLRWLLA